MQYKTAISDAMQKSGIDTNANLLYTVAVEALRKNGVVPRAALKDFVEEVRDAESLMTALHSRQETEAAAIRYLERVAKDMKSPERGGAAHPSDESQEGSGRPKVSPQGDAVAQLAAESQVLVGGGKNLDSECAHSYIASHTIDSASLSNPKAGEAPNPLLNARKIIAPSPASKPRNLDDFRAIRKVTSAFDSYILRDGTPLGELRWSALGRMIGANAREAALLRLIRNHAVPSDPNAYVRDVVREGDLEKMIQKAAEVSDAA